MSKRSPHVGRHVPVLVEQRAIGVERDQLIWVGIHEACGCLVGFAAVCVHAWHLDDSPSSITMKTRRGGNLQPIAWRESMIQDKVFTYLESDAMGRNRVGTLGLLGLLAMLVVAGCDSSANNDITPPEPVTPESDQVLTIGFMIPERGFLAAEVWEQVFRHGAAREHVLSEVFRTPPGAQAAAVRELAGHHLDALIIVADKTDPKLPAALAEVANQLPLLFLESAVPVEGKAPPRVLQAPVDHDARAMVEAVLEDAKKAGFPDNGPAVLLVNGPFDDKGRARIEAVRRALEAAKVTILPQATFQGFMKEGGEALQATLDAHPDLAIVIAEEDQGARAAGTVRDNLPKTAKPFVLAAFGDSKELRQMANFNLFSALVERDLAKQSEEALSAAIRLARGEPVEPEVIIHARFTRAAGPPMHNPMADAVRQRPGLPDVPLKGRAPKEEPN